MMNTLQFFNKFPMLITLIYNIYYHMKERNYDFPFVICNKKYRN